MEFGKLSMQPGSESTNYSHGNSHSLPVNHSAKYIQMPKENYDIMLAKLHDQDSKLKASLNLHLLFYNKEGENKMLRERNALLEQSTAASELRLGNLIRLHMEQAQQFKSLPGLEPEMRAVQTKHSASKLLPQPDEPNVLEGPRLNTGRKDPMSSYTEFQNATNCQHSTTSYRTVHKTGQENTTSTLEEPAVSGSLSLQGRRAPSLPGISRDLFDRVVMENLKLKQLLEDTLKKVGKNLDIQLDNQEYEDVIKQLRIELSNCKDQIETLNDALNNSPSNEASDLRKKYAELVRNNGKLEKSLQAKQTLINSYNREYEALKFANQELNRRLEKQGVSAHMTGSVVKEVVDKSTETKTDSSGNSPNSDALDANVINSEKKMIENLHEQVERLKGLLHNKEDEFKQSLAQFQQTNRKLMEELGQLEDKEKRDGNTKQRELDLYKEKVEGLETRNKQLGEELSSMALLKIQLQTYEEDFKNEKMEQMKNREILEKKVNESQHIIRKLRDEKQLMIEKYQSLRQQFDRISQQPRFTSSVGSSVSCGQSLKNQAHMPWQYSELPQQVTMDMVPSSDLSLPQPPSAGRSQQGKLEETPPSNTQVLVCDRCEREFQPHEHAKYADHILKCTDD